MGYALEAIIGCADTLQTVVPRLPSATLVVLTQGLAMVPMTEELFDAVTDGTSDRSLGFRMLPSGFDGMLAAWSSAGPVGYVEADFFGGVGAQRAALWIGGDLVLGPVVVDEGQSSGEAGSPISQLLRQLGVARDGHRDEFEAVGLGRCRQTTDWLR